MNHSEQKIRWIYSHMAMKMEHMASVINKPEMIKLREEAGAIFETQKMIKLVE